jgi:hypothetical protein
MDPIADKLADTILVLIAVHGKDAVTAAAVRTLPVITFAESNEAIGKYKDDACDARKELASLNRLITNLEGEVVRQAKELALKDKEKATSRPPLIDRIAGCPGAYITNSNPHKILVEDPKEEIIAEAISLSDDMVLATIHCEGGGGSQVYMPLHHFLELYTKL